MRIRGFTLLEVMLAMSIFAMIGLGTYQLLRTVITTSTSVQHNNEESTALIRAFNVIESDLSQFVRRGIRDDYGDQQPPLMVDTGPYTLEFTRTGWNNPARFPRSNLQRVAYQLENDVLQRNFWLVLDRSTDSDLISQDLLQGVIDFRVSVLDGSGGQSNTWPNLDENDQFILQGVEITLESESQGEIRRIFSLPASSAQYIEGDTSIIEQDIEDEVDDSEEVEEPDE